MLHGDAVAPGIQPDLDLLLYARGRLGRLIELQSGAVPLVLDRAIVGGVGAGHDLRCVPKTVPAVITPDISAGLADLGKFLEQIGTADEAQSDDAGTDIRGRDQFNILVGKPDTPGPTAVRNTLHLNSHKPSTNVLSAPSPAKTT